MEGLGAWEDQDVCVPNVPEQTLVQRSVATAWVAQQIFLPALCSQFLNFQAPILVLPNGEGGLGLHGAMAGLLLVLTRGGLAAQHNHVDRA